MHHTNGHVEISLNAHSVQNVAHIAGLAAIILACMIAAFTQLVRAGHLEGCMQFTMQAEDASLRHFIRLMSSLLPAAC